MPFSLSAPDQPITTGELLAVALDDEPEDTEPDADKAEADAQCQVAGRGGDHPGAAAVVVLTQDTFNPLRTPLSTWTIGLYPEVV